MGSAALLFRVGRIGKIGGVFVLWFGGGFLLIFPFFLLFFFVFLLSLPSVYLVAKWGCCMFILGFLEADCKDTFCLVYFKLQEQEE